MENTATIIRMTWANDLHFHPTYESFVRPDYRTIARREYFNSQYYYVARGNRIPGRRSHV